MECDNTKEKEIDMKPARNQNIPCIAIMGFYWASNAIYFALLSAFLLDRGYSAFAVGIVSTILYLVSTLLGPVSGYITDSLLPPKRYIPAAMALSIPFVLAVPLVVDSFILTILCVIVAAFCQNLLFGVIDSWIMKLKETRSEVTYPIARSMGSIGYSVAAAVAGYIAGFLGYDVIFPLNILCCLLVAFCALKMEPVPCSNRSHGTEKKIGFLPAMKILCTNFQFVAYVLSMLCIYTCTRFTLIFHPNLIEHVGGTSTDLGISIFMSAIFEVPVMVFATRYYRRFDPRKLALIGLLIGASKPVILYFADSVPVFWAAQATQAVSIGMFLPLAVSYLRRIVPKQIYATAIMVNSAATSGLSGIFASFFGGILMDISRELFLIVAIGFGVAAVVLYGLSMLKKYDNTGWYDA